MNDIKAISKLLEDLSQELDKCTRCGTCQSVCPLFDRTGREMDVARGKLALLDGLVQSLFDDPEGVNQRLNKCLMCGSCAAGCPAGVDTIKIFYKARSILTAFVGLSHPKRMMLRKILSNPALFDQVVERAVKFQKWFVKTENDTVGTSCAKMISPMILQRHFKPLAPIPFHQMVSKKSGPVKPSSTSKLKVFFFYGCLIDKILPHIGQAVLKILKDHDIDVIVPNNQGCCGIPALSMGDSKSFHQLVEYHLDLFSKVRFDYLITACATCTYTIKKLWPMMAPRAKTVKLDELASRTMDVNQFLVNQAGLKPKSVSKSESGKIPVTYHDPCHLKKSLGIYKEPRQVIEANPAYRLIEMDQSDWCCGLGGNFNLSYYDISVDIGHKKKDMIAKTQSKIVATGCPACILQLSDVLSQSGLKIAVKHPVELYLD